MKKVALTLLAFAIASIFMLNLVQADKNIVIADSDDDDPIIEIHCIPITKWKF